MANTLQWRPRQVALPLLSVCAVSYVLLYVLLYAQSSWNGRQSLGGPSVALFDSLSLSEDQCRAAFPGLTKPVDQQVRRGPFDLPLAGADLGPLQARVRNGHLSIVAAEKPGLLPSELLDARAAALHQIHRALLSAPSPADSVPDTVFALNIQDQPFGSAWTYSLPAYATPSSSNAPIGRAFLMPHFSFWAWRPRMVGSFERAAKAIERLESSLPPSASSSSLFARKDPRAVWRGTARFGSPHHPELRRQLVAATRGQSWADVQELEWLPEGNNANAMREARNALMIEDFCRYKYVVHTEGITYSGRFQFHQLCRSVVLTPPISWMQHTTHLVRPLYASDLDLDEDTPPWSPTADEEQAWPHAAPDEANLVFVNPDWSNLGATVRWLEKHPAAAEGIASRQRALFADQGYLSPAAEACYWRALLRGWAQVVQYNDTAVDEGVPWELYSLSSSR